MANRAVDHCPASTAARLAVYLLLLLGLDNFAGTRSAPLSPISSASPPASTSMPSSTTAQATVWSIPGGSGSGEVSGSGDASGSGGATSGTASAVLPTTLPGNCCLCKAADIRRGNYSISPEKDNYMTGDRVALSCPLGYVFEASYSMETDITCGDSGWTQSPLSSNCVPVLCPLPNVTHLEWVGDNAGFGNNTTLNFTCRNGYYLRGVERSQCQSNGMWSEPLPSCVPPVCSPVDYASGSYGGNTSCRCPDGFRELSDGTESGDASGEAAQNVSLPKCEYIKCSVLADPLNGFVNSSGNYVNSSAVFSCDYGSSLSGTSEVFCSAEGHWQPPLDQVCIRQCDAPDMIANGSRNGTYTVGNRVVYTCDMGFRLTISTNTSAVIECKSDRRWNASAPTCLPDSESPGSSLLLVYILVPVLGLLVALAIIIVVVCTVYLPRQKKRRTESKVFLIPDSEKPKKQRGLQDSWVYDQRQEMKGMTIVRPGHGLVSSTSTASTLAALQANSNTTSLQNPHSQFKTLSAAGGSAATMETSLSYEKDSNVDRLSISDDQLALFAKPADVNVLDEDDDEAILRAELDELIRGQLSTHSRKHDRRSGHGSESDLSSAQLAPVDQSTFSHRNQSLQRRSNAGSDAESLQGSQPQTPSTQKSQGPLKAGQVDLAGSRTRSATFMELVKRYDNPKWGTPSPKAALVNRHGRKSLLLEDTDAADEYSDAYDTPDTLARQVTHDSPIVSSREPSMKRRAYSDILPPIPSNLQRHLSLRALSDDSRRSSKYLSKESVRSSDTAGAQSGGDPEDDVEVNPYEDLKAIRAEIKGGAEVEKSLQELLAESTDCEADERGLGDISQQHTDGRRTSTRKEKKVKPYDDLRAIRRQLESELQSQEDVMPYAKVPYSITKIGKSTTGADGDDDDEDATPYAAVPHRLSVISTDDRETLDTKSSFHGSFRRSFDRLSEDEDATPYAAVPHRLSVISTDDRETLDTKSSFRGSFRRSFDRLSEDEGISTDGTTTTNRAAESEGSGNELPHLEVILDQPLREGEKTPPYARVRVGKKRSSVTKPATTVVSSIERNESLGNDSGIQTSNDTKRKTSSLQRKLPEWRRVLKEQWSSDESETDTKAGLASKGASLTRSAKHAAGPGTVQEFRLRDQMKNNVIILGPLSVHPDKQAESLANTPELPRRTPYSHILDRPHNKRVYS